MKQIRLIQWNISTRCRVDEIIHFLKSRILETPTVVCLQEAVRKDFDAINEGLGPASSAYSLDYRKPGRNEGQNRRMGVAILSFNAEIAKAGLLQRTVFPERTLWAHIGNGLQPIRLLSFHSLTGVGYKNAKASNFATIADYLQENPDLDFMCFDANEPKTDSLNIDELEFWKTNGDNGRNIALIMGPQKVHQLEDSYRKYAQSLNSSTTTALPVTHYTGKAGRRYDYIFSSPRWEVVNIDHPLEGSVNATSDHSAVIADLEPAE